MAGGNVTSGTSSLEQVGFLGVSLEAPWLGWFSELGLSACFASAWPVCVFGSHLVGWRPCGGPVCFLLFFSSFSFLLSPPPSSFCFFFLLPPFFVFSLLSFFLLPTPFFFFLLSSLPLSSFFLRGWFLGGRFHPFPFFAMLFLNAGSLFPLLGAFSLPPSFAALPSDLAA